MQQIGSKKQETNPLSLYHSSVRKQFEQGTNKKF